MKKIVAIIFFVLAGSLIAFGQNTVSGRITDTEGEPLPFASIVITHSIENGVETPVRTQQGTTSDINGFYTITAISGGIFVIQVVYIGYESYKFQVDFTGGVSNIKMDVTMISGSVNLQEVVISAMARGQMAAINQQVNALGIVNVVSSDRIRQIPDANAAESIGRLPGITVTRSGGEASGIVVRGMQGYNNITVNGVSVPVNLTSISQYALQNVEVFKSINASMDASAPAGTVNLDLGIAPDETTTNIMVQGGYGDLNNTLRNYKFNLGSNWRLFDKRLGISVNLAAEETDRGTEQLLAGIGVGSQSVIEGERINLQTNSVTLRNVDNPVKRKSAIVTADYRFSPTASIKWSNIATHSPGGSLYVNHNFSGGAGNASYSINDNTANNNYNYSSILSANHLLGRIKVNYSASLGYSNNYTSQRSTSLLNLNAFKQTLTVEQMQTLSHKEYVNLAQLDNTHEAINRYKLTNSTHAQPGLSLSTSESNTLNSDARINMELPYSIGNLISGNLKWGGRYRYQQSDQVTYGVRKESHYFPAILMGFTPVTKEDGTLWNDDIHLTPGDYDNNGHILGSYLLNADNYNNNFLNQGYTFGWYPNMNRLNDILTWYDDMTNYAYNQGIDYWRPIWTQILQLQKEAFNDNARGTKDNYINHYAGYIMTELKIGNKLDFVPGARYERYHYNMNTWNIRNEIISDLQLTGEPVSGTHENVYILPMMQLKYKPISWLQGLFSYTETLKRPSVGQLEPYVYEDKIGMSYTAGNPNLKPEHWTSIDLGVAAHSRKVGLFSVNLFYKQVKDKIAVTNWTKMSIDTIALGSFQPTQRVDVTQTINHPYVGIARGIEAEWQTNFWYLPKPFSYFTLNLNYSYINNVTTYVYIATSDSLVGYGRGNRPIYEQIRFNRPIEGPMTNQPSQLFNGSLGFSYNNFQVYVSYQYFGEIFLQKTVIEETDAFKNAFNRLDMQANYKLPVKGLELMFNMSNITDTREVRKLRGDDRPTSIERYGLTANLGLRFSF